MKTPINILAVSDKAFTYLSNHNIKTVEQFIEHEINPIGLDHWVKCELHEVQDTLIGVKGVHTCYNCIEPTKKEHEAELAFWMKKLKITLPQEEFILKCLLSLDWRREVIIETIEEIKYVNRMVRFKFLLKAPRVSVSYSASNVYKETGWSSDLDSFEKRAWYVYHTFRNYCK